MTGSSVCRSLIACFAGGILGRAIAMKDVPTVVMAVVVAVVNIVSGIVYRGDKIRNQMVVVVNIKKELEVSDGQEI